jgi:hypothetical protein
MHIIKRYIKKINELRNTQKEHIGKLCIKNNNNIDCPYDDENNKYDILNELFIQLIYQFPLLKKDKCSTYIINNCNWQYGKQEIYDDINYLFKDNEYGMSQDIKFYFNKWFCKYISVNYQELSIYDCNNEIPISIDTLSGYDKLNIKNEIWLIKLLFYYYLR